MSTGGRSPRIAIVGSGMSGICMAATLKRAGMDFTVFEKADRLGGTWRDNTYPGLACDVPSRFYQFTFAPNPDWTHLFSPGAEIWAYFDKVAEDTGVIDHVRFGTEVVRAEWKGASWSVETSDGTVDEYDFVISATGILHHPRYPKIRGLESFEGATFHSARWDHSVPLEGKRVAVLGTGSTGVQIVCGLAGVAAKVEIFQRTAQWVISISNPEVSTVNRAAHRRIPGLNTITYYLWRFAFERLAPALTEPGLRRRLIAGLARRSLAAVSDPELRRKLTPDYEPMCKRLVLSGGFYDAIQRSDVELVTDAIDHIEARGIVTTDGRLHEIDVLALATGFDAHAYMRPMNLIGTDGLTIDEAWADGPKAFQTVSIPGFPNFFMFMGPNSPVGNYSLTAIAETQANHMLGWINRWRSSEIETVSPTADATDDFYVQVRAAMPNTVWTTGCDSWYLGANGEPELFPWTPDHHRKQLGTIRPGSYTTTSPIRSRSSGSGHPALG